MPPLALGPHYIIPQLRESLLRAVTDADPSPTVNIYEYTERVSLDTIASAGL